MRFKSGTLDLSRSGSTLGANADAYFGAQTGLEADLSSATAATINELREAFALQRFAEALARWGSRYTEYLRYCGVIAEDQRLQRPEYLPGDRDWETK